MPLSRAFRLQIAGASTDVGKTVLATALALALAQRKKAEVDYLKPISTGPRSENDAAHLERLARRRGLEQRVKTRTLRQLGEPLSPHLAQERAHGRGSWRARDDQGLLDELGNCLEVSKGAVLVEQAGGVHSPVLSGRSQADFYRPLRLPTLLVADKKLGGISNTVSSYESLRTRGYTVDGIAIFREDHYQNWKWVRDWVERENEKALVRMAFCALEPPPERRQDEADLEAMGAYYGGLVDGAILPDFLQGLETIQADRLAQLDTMASETLETLWYPFTQHKTLQPKDVTVIDSAHDDLLTTYKDGHWGSTFDGPASWWTQGLGHGNAELAMTAAHAAGRYGHVILPNATHEPVLALTRRLLDSPLARGWAKRVFYSDNGSTAMEVAIKMAIRSACQRHGWRADPNESQQEIGIIGLEGAYHGDTIGAMDASEANIFNQAVDWYKGRGAWFEPPQVMVRHGRAEIKLNDRWIPKGTLEHVYDVEDRLKSDPMAAFYRSRTVESLDQLESRGQYLGALILEPCVMGAGGMIFVDPLFQRVLVDSVRERVPAQSKTGSAGIPVIFDEVFAGLYRCGRARAGSFLGESTLPDISCHAKLLTGGLVPLGVTLTAPWIFETFYRDAKAEALLHGHSYTGYPVGCAVALQAMETLAKLESTGAWTEFKRPWTAPGSTTTTTTTTPVWSVFSPHFVSTLSAHPDIEGVMALGSVLAIYLEPQDAGQTGYASTVSARLADRLRSGMDGGVRMMVRPLGHVVYLMTGQETKRELVMELERTVLAALDGRDG